MTTEEPNEFMDGFTAGWNEALEEAAGIAEEHNGQAFPAVTIATKIRALKREP